MSIDKRLENINEEQAHGSWSTAQTDQYNAQQYAYREKLFGPILAKALGVTQVPKSELVALYSPVDPTQFSCSAAFSRAYIFYAQHPEIAGSDPTMVVGKLIILKAYAHLKQITESQAAIAFLNSDVDLFREFNDRYTRDYLPAVQRQLEKYKPKLAHTG